MKILQKAEIIAQLQSEILHLQGFKPLGQEVDLGLGLLKNAFPQSIFPLGAVHEFLTPAAEHVAATSGFLSALLATLMGNSGTTLWISAQRNLFPPALKIYGLKPEHFIFIDLPKEKDVMWVMEEALKCSALTAVVGETPEISFTASRRLQLAVEQSQVTGFMFRKTTRKPATSACVSRWKITSLPSLPLGDLPGISFPQWKVELLRIRNGKPGAWNVQWKEGKLETIAERPGINTDYFERQAG